MRMIAVRNAAGVVLLVAAALAVAGCGGGSKSSAPPAVTVTVVPTTPATTTTASTTEHTTTTAATTGSSSSLEDCSSLTGFGQAFSKALAAGAATGGGGLGAQADVFESFADKAPAEIRDQLRIIADAIAKYAEALKGVDLKSGQAPTPDVIAKLQAAATEINQPAVAAAGKQISTWVASHCHA